MHVGITGARGTLGRILQAQLGAAGVRFDCFAGDVCRPEELRAWLLSGGFDAIVHFAALVPTPGNEDKLAALLTAPLALALGCGFGALLRQGFGGQGLPRVTQAATGLVLRSSLGSEAG